MNQYKTVLNKYNQLVASNNSHSQPQNCSQLQYKNKKLNSNLKQLESRYIELDNLYKLQQNKTKTMQDQIMQVRNALKNQNPKQNDDCKYALNVQTIMLKTQLEIKRNNQNQLKKYLGSTPYIIFEGEHYFDYKLSQILNQFYRQENIKSVGDLGCGKCQYIIKLHQNGFQAKGYDGNPLANHSIVQKKDLSQIQNLDMQFDFIQSFEVGQHIFSEYQNNFIFNLCRHAKKGIVMSWAALGQGGFMHVNNRNQQYLIPKIQMHGFKYNKEKSDWFKSHHELALYFQSNIMVFYRQ